MFAYVTSVLVAGFDEARRGRGGCGNAVIVGMPIGSETDRVILPYLCRYRFH